MKLSISGVLEWRFATAFEMEVPDDFNLDDLDTRDWQMRMEEFAREQVISNNEDPFSSEFDCDDAKIVKPKAALRRKESK